MPERQAIPSTDAKRRQPRQNT